MHGIWYLSTVYVLILYLFLLSLCLFYAIYLHACASRAQYGLSVQLLDRSKRDWRFCMNTGATVQE